MRDDFDQLNRQLRSDLLNNEGSRGQVLEQLFAGMDLIGETPAGKTFYAFWRLLTDIEQATIFSEAPDGHPKSPTCGHFKFLHLTS